MRNNQVAPQDAEQGGQETFWQKLAPIEPLGGRWVDADRRGALGNTRRQNATFLDIATSFCLAITQFVLVLVAYLDAKLSLIHI